MKKQTAAVREEALCCAHEFITDKKSSTPYEFASPMEYRETL